MHEQLLIELVRRYSPSRHETEAVSYLVDWMNAHGFRASVDDAGSACGVRGADDAPNTLMLLGHIDTFPGEIAVRVEDGILYGRGSVDAKGSLCAFAAAAAQAAIPEHWRVIVVGAVEEECATSKGAYFVRDHFEPTLCIIGEPSGSGRITLGYKGRLLIDYELSQPAAHSARPEPSAAAIGAAFWQAIVDWAARENSGADGYFEQVMPRLNQIHSNNDAFHERVALTVGFRLPPRWPPEAVLDVVSRLATDSATLQPRGMERAFQSSRTNPLARAMTAAIRAQGKTPGYILKTGTSDMNVVGARWACPIIAYGPGDSSLDHTPNEHLPLAEYSAAITTLQTLIEQQLPVLRL